MSRKYILAIDQGTTSSRAVLLDTDGTWIGSAGRDFQQYFPKAGWVEHNPEEIWESVEDSIRKVIETHKVNPKDILTIGITNQRETVVAWNSKSSKAVYNAIVWQCRRTSDFCSGLRKKKGLSATIRKKTGLVIDPYFSATKISWLLKNNSEAKRLAKQNLLKVGTIDTYLLWKLTSGLAHKTEVSNASRTMLMNLKSLNWDQELLNLFQIPSSILPKIESSNHLFGYTKGLSCLPDGIPISGMIGDQQGALFGQTCFSPGDVKCTYGTGSFILLNTGEKLAYSKHGMLTTVAWRIDGKTAYAIEGGAFICGAAVQWLRDGLGFIKSSDEIELLARSVDSSDGVEFVPALTGLGAPYWESEARGMIMGLTRGTNRGHIARATLDAMALQNVDIVKAMEKDLGKKIKGFYVDGGAAANNLLMQLQSDYLGTKVIRPQIIETTVLGAGFMAGLGLGIWKNLTELKQLNKKDSEFESVMSIKMRKKRLESWHGAVEKLL